MSSFGAQLSDAYTHLKPNMGQFLLACVLTMMVATCKKLAIYPLNYIGGKAECIKTVAPPEVTWFTNHTLDGWDYTVHEVEGIKDGCVESAAFVVNSILKKTNYLILFGVTKAVFNFITGGIADTLGRKWAHALGWVTLLPLPFMVIYGDSWGYMTASNFFLGMMQALSWSSAIFIMADYLGKKHSGLAIGINETVGYTTIAIVNVIVPSLMDDNDPRRAQVYWIILGITIVGIVVSASPIMKESRDVVILEENKLAGITDASTKKKTVFTWPSGQTYEMSMQKAAFIQVTFVNPSMMAIAQAGLMINFLAALAWGLLVTWLKRGHSGSGTWAKLPKQEVANVVFCYGIPKGVGQFMFGFLGDRIGRKKLIVSGLSLCTVALIFMAVVGEFTNGSGIYGLMCLGAFLLGFGTTMMYTNNLAAICDHTDPTWRASGLGAYRFWRDLGYAIGGLVSGSLADSIGIPWTIVFVSGLTATSATIVGVFYKENRDYPSSSSSSTSKSTA